MSDTSGRMSYAPFARWDHDSQSWKTSEATSLWALTLSSLTLPTSGGLRNGSLYERQMPEPATSGHDSLSLPTPVADHSRGLPSSTTDYASLANVAAALLPTPAVNDMGEGKTLEWWDDWAPRQKAADGRPAPHGRSLAIEAQRLLPTPTTQHSSGGYNPEWGHGMTLLDAAKEIVEWTGSTTRQPFTDGNTSSDDPHQPQLSLDSLALPA